MVAHWRVCGAGVSAARRQAGRLHHNQKAGGTPAPQPEGRRDACTTTRTQAGRLHHKLFRDKSLPAIRAMAMPRENDEPEANRSIRDRLAIALVGAIVLAAAFLAGREFAPARPEGLAHDREEIRGFLESYFRVWSAGDMVAYRSHFDPSAQVALLDQGRVAVVAELDPFMEKEEKLRRETTVPMRERMVSFTADADETTAHVTAQWELKKGDDITTGVDRFTLVRDRQGTWKILFLAFYQRSK
jgi:hypothetical protein